MSQQIKNKRFGDKGLKFIHVGKKINEKGRWNAPAKRTKKKPGRS